MSLRAKLTLIVLFVGIVPLAVSAFITLRIHDRDTERHVQALQSSLASQGATAVSSQLADAQERITSLLKSLSWQRLTGAERRGALTLLYRQLDDIAVASLFDERGEGIGGSIFVESGGGADANGHPTVSMSLLGEYVQHIPFDAAQSQGVATGDAFTAAPDSAAMLPLAVRVVGRGEQPWVVAVALSLRSACALLGKIGAEGAAVYLIDPKHRDACAPARTASMLPILEGALTVGAGQLARVGTERGEVLALVSEAVNDWSVLVEQPSATAFASSRSIIQQTLFWIGIALLIALAAGLVLGRGITVPVRGLVAGALELAKGNFAYRLPIAGNDELAKLSRTFNHMGDEIEKRDAEIRAWNADLQQRVEERTRELKEAQDQLLQSQKIAAVSSLGAGIAHEINNPLTGVLGLAQILLLNAQTGKLTAEQAVPLLTQVEKEAHRIKGIVGTLVSFSRQFAGETFQLFSLPNAVDESLELVRSQLESRHIEVKKDLDANVPELLGDFTQIQQALLHIFNNACTAMVEGGTLTIRSKLIEGQAVRIQIADTGKGIARENLHKIFEPFFTTKDDWEGKGLGLTVAYRIIEEHHGQIRVDSEVGKGTTMNIILPLGDRKSHLV